MGTEVKIYFDACCFCRPFDDLTVDRVFLEAEAVLIIVKHCQSNGWTIAASDALNAELRRIRDARKLAKVKAFYQNANDWLTTVATTTQLANNYQRDGVKVADSFHLALAESNDYDFLLTTDDDFARTAAKISLRTRVCNPLIYLMEI
ncbi:hypothetical protein FACS1894139_05050 [Planctomycetales bacterium]|nr:hypothetical protein FACS1894107_03210 [Planctomycetales bacterium]GHS97054.1 hypothetical protein FACS1894108_02790 [Planctomycetales bacterium]GHT03847.1 hypothetical protein FACS1894139_05050 [Planctomycetales bacterium]